MLRLRRFWTTGTTVTVGLTILTAYAGLLRFHEIGQQCFWIDEAFSTLHARAIIEHGIPLLQNGRISWSYAPVHYLMVPGLLLFGNIHVGARVLAAFAGTVLIPVFYFFNKQMFGSRLQALLASLMLTCMTYEVAWSRQARGYTTLQLVILLSMLCTTVFFKTKRSTALTLAVIAAGAGMMVHRAGYLAIAFLVLCAIFHVAGDPREWKAWSVSRIPTILFNLLILCAVAATLVGMHTNSSVFTTLQGIAAAPEYSYAGMYVSFVVMGLLRMLAFWLTLGVGFACYTHPKKAWPLVITVGLYLLVIFFRTRLFHLRYLLPALPFLLGMAAYSFSSMVSFSRSLPRRSHRIAFNAVLTCCFLVSIPYSEMVFFPRDYYYLGDTVPQPDWKTAFDWIHHDHAGDGKTNAVSVISTFPEMADFYLPTETARKYFLPFSFSGHSMETQTNAPYSSATTISSPREIGEVGGYIVLDNLGLLRLDSQELSRYLIRLGPTYVVPGRASDKHPLYIWKVEPAIDEKQ